MLELTNDLKYRENESPCANIAVHVSVSRNFD